MTGSAKKVPAARRAPNESAARMLLDLGAARAFAAEHLPAAEVRQKFGGASWLVGGKVFAFTRPKGLALKLPAEAIASLRETREARYLTMGQRTMREWVLIPLPDGEDYARAGRLLRAAMRFVQSLTEE